MRKRKTISAAIVLSGLVLFVIIINLPDKNGQGTPNANALGQNNGSSGLGFQVNQNRNLVANPSTNGVDATTTDNMTDLLAQGLSQNILQMNNGFDQGTSTIKLPSPDSLTGAISQAANNQSIQFPNLTEKDIRINPDNSTGTQISYIKTLGDITKKNFAGFNTPILTILNNFFEQNNSEGLAKYVDIAGNEIGDLLALKVPAQLSAWHLQNLNLWERKIVVYKAILNLSDDPLKTTLAIQQVNNIGQENENIQKVLNDYVKKLTANG